MAWELLDIGDDPPLPVRVRTAADSLSKIDPCARKRPLERTENELAVLDQVKADPKEAEGLFKNCRDVGEIVDKVGFAGYQGRYLLDDLVVDRDMPRIYGLGYHLG